MSDTRTRIAEHIHAHPGVHFNGLVRALDLAPGQIQFHLKTLLGQQVFVKEQLYGRTHYYSDGFDPWERQALALLRRETTRDIIAVLLEDSPTSPRHVTDRVSIARSTLEWHLDRLEANEIVTKERDDNRHVTLVVDRQEELSALLSEADPTLLARLLDRYTRLVDHLLTE